VEFSGKWHVVEMPDRELVFSSDGTGYFNAQGDSMPFFKWWLTESGLLGWQFFSDSAMTAVVSRPHEPEYDVLHGGAELRFVHAPFPFGIRHFRRSTDA
jgi:hypothetical protein